MPDAIEIVPIDIVNEPDTTPELFVTVPDAVTVAPNNDTEPLALNDQLPESEYVPKRFNAVPPNGNDPVEVKPALGLHDITRLLIGIPGTTVKLLIGIVNPPVETPASFENAPDTEKLLPNNDNEPLAVNDQLLESEYVSFTLKLVPPNDNEPTPVKP